MAEKEIEEPQELIVVEELPKQPISDVKDDKSGKSFHFMTRDEVLAEIYKDIQKIKKVVA